MSNNFFRQRGKTFEEVTEYRSKFKQDGICRSGYKIGKLSFGTERFAV